MVDSDDDFDIEWLFAKEMYLIALAKKNLGIEVGEFEARKLMKSSSVPEALKEVRNRNRLTVFINRIKRSINTG